MDTVTAKELAGLDEAAVRVRLLEYQREYFARREAVRVGKEKNHAQLSYLRRQIARAKTVLRQRQGSQR